MPPVGHERFTQPAPEEQARRQELRQKARAAHNLMKGIAIESPKVEWSIWRRVFSLDMPKRSAVVTYGIEGQPAHIKIQAWVEELPYVIKPVALKTCLISDVSGEPKAISSDRIEAYTSDGELAGWAVGVETNDEMQRIEDIHETLELIAHGQ